MSRTKTSIGSTQDFHASLVHRSSSSSHPEDVRSRIISVSFEHLPVEIVGLIAFHAEPCDLSALCRVNRYCSAVCTAVLYGDHIIINDSQSLSLLHNTLLRLRPDLALVVREITIHAGVGGAGWWLSGPAGYQALQSIMSRGALAIAACVNLQSLTIRTSESSGQSPFPLFDELLDFGLRLPVLRHISFSFLLRLNSMEFIERHSEQLEFLSIYMTGDVVGRQFVFSGELCNSFSIPLPISTIHCSPLLTPIFVPSSRITDVSLYWPCRRLELDELPHVAKNIIVPLTQSGRPVIVLAYASHVWHIEFMALAAVQLQELQYLRIDNCNEKGQDLMDIRNRNMLSELSNILPSFKTLKILLLYDRIRRNLQVPGSTYDDFKLMRTWTSLCPTLVYCDLPASRTLTWIRHPSYDFFVIDKEGEDVDFATEFGHDWERKFVETEEMSEYSARWSQQYEDLRDDRVMEMLKPLLDRGNKLSQ